MLFKSGLVTQVSGSVGGMTGSRNRGGMYFRARALPVNPNTPQQVVVRNAMVQLTSRWGDTLTDDDRLLWNLYGENTPVLNKLGDEITLSGISHFIRSNIPRLQTGLPIVDRIIGPNNLGELGELAMVNPSAGAGTYDITFQENDSWVDEDGSALLIYSSSGQNPAINYFTGPYRFAGRVDGNATTAPTSPATITSPFPFAEGQNLFFQARVSRADGRLTSPFRGTAVALA